MKTRDLDAVVLPGGLRWTSDQEPGIRRRRSGPGFSYRDQVGARISDRDVLRRIRALALPPAWTDVWITAWSDGHLQATGRDARRRKQYRYHAIWEATRATEKYARVLRFAAGLPRIRRQVEQDLSLPGLSRPAVVASVVRILDETLIRIGNDEYAEANHSYGLTTVERQHITVRGRTVRFAFVGKGGKEVVAGIEDARVARIIRRCEELPGRRLFTCVDEDGSRHDIGSAAVNDYLREASEEHVTAKDFRTWAATLLAAQTLGHEPLPASARERRRQILAAADLAAESLGNTRAVCRRSYLHPAVLEERNEKALRRVMAAAPPSGPRGLRADERRLLAFLKEVPATDEERRRAAS